MTQGSPKRKMRGGHGGGEGRGLCIFSDQDICAHGQLGPPTDCTELVRSAGAALLAPAADKEGSQQSPQIIQGVTRNLRYTLFGLRKNLP